MEKVEYKAINIEIDGNVMEVTVTGKLEKVDYETFKPAGRPGRCGRTSSLTRSISTTSSDWRSSANRNGRKACRSFVAHLPRQRSNISTFRSWTRPASGFGNSRIRLVHGVKRPPGPRVEHFTRECPRRHHVDRCRIFLP